MCVCIYAHTHACLLKSISSYLVSNSNDVSKKNKANIPTVSAWISTLNQILINVVDHRKWFTGIRIDKMDRQAIKLSLTLWFNQAFYTLRWVKTLEPLERSLVSPALCWGCLISLEGGLVPEVPYKCGSVTQSCPAICDPVDYSLPGSSVCGFPRQESWSRLPISSPRGLPNPGIEPQSSASPVLQVDSLPLSHWGGPSRV